MMNATTIKIVKDVQKETPKIEPITKGKDKILSPRIKEIMKKNESCDNFMKVQWPWIA